MKLPAYRPSPFQRLVQRLAMRPLNTRLLAAVLPTLDRFALRLSSGRQTLTSLLTGLPTFLVTSRGARSGLPRVTPLVGIVDEEHIVLVASNFGKPAHPAWYHNLRAHPDVGVRFQEQSGQYHARQAEPDEARRLLELADAYYPGYALYRQRAFPRQIAVMVLKKVD